MTLKERLEIRKSMLDTIDRRRRLEGDPHIGWYIEHRIIQEELDELVNVPVSHWSFTFLLCRIAVAVLVAGSSWFGSRWIS